MTEQDSTKLLFLLEQYRPEPHAVKASDTEMRNLPSNLNTSDMASNRTGRGRVISQVLIVTDKLQFKD